MRELKVLSSSSYPARIRSRVAMPDSDQDSKLMTAAAFRGVTEAQGRQVEMR
jgi:hypothetical protein